MTDLATTNVEILEWWYEGDRGGQPPTIKTVRAKIESGTAGGTTNKVVPAAFGLQNFLNCTNLLIDDTTDVMRPAVISKDGAALYFGGLSTATLTNALADIDFTSVDGYITVSGKH